MSNIVQICPYSNIQTSIVVKCVRHTSDRTNDHLNESLPIKFVGFKPGPSSFVPQGFINGSTNTAYFFIYSPLKKFQNKILILSKSLKTKLVILIWTGHIDKMEKIFTSTNLLLLAGLTLSMKAKHT